MGAGMGALIAVVLAGSGPGRVIRPFPEVEIRPATIGRLLVYRRDLYDFMQRGAPRLSTVPGAWVAAEPLQPLEAGAGGVFLFERDTAGEMQVTQMAVMLGLGLRW